MLAQGHGKIINMASMATLLVPHPQKQIAYNASKAAVVKITQVCSLVLAHSTIKPLCCSRRSFFQPTCTQPFER